MKKGDKYENRVWSQYVRRPQRSELNCGCRRRRKEGDGQDLERSIPMFSTRGSVIAGSLKSRASDDRVRTRRRERGRKNVRCTCLYLFCIISAALPRVPRRPAGFTAGLISFHFFGTRRGAIPHYLAKSLPPLRELIRPRY